MKLLMNPNRRVLAVAIVIGMTLGTNVRAASPAQTLVVPTLGKVTIYQPDTSPQQVVLFLSGDGGWNLGVIGMAERLRRATRTACGAHRLPEHSWGNGWVLRPGARRGSAMLCHAEQSSR